MREADIEENDESPNNGTIKRAPESKSNDNEQQEIPFDSSIDTNNNTLERNHLYESIPENPNDNYSTLKIKQDRSISPCHGIPSVPRVHMGAGFMKIFNQCPLEIYASYCWVNSETKDEFVFIAAEEGIYSLNLNELHDATLELLYPRRTTWLFVNDNILWSISGKSNSLYRHDLPLLIQTKSTSRLSLPLNKFQIHGKFEKLIPKKSAASVKINNTRGCIRCCVGRNQYTGFIFLAGMLPHEIFLMQYYDPLRKFMILKTVSISIPFEPKVFQMIFSPENQYAYICIGVSKSKSPPNSFKFAIINFETERVENYDDVPLVSNVSQVKQHEKDADTVLICQDNHINIVNTQGKPQKNRQILSELNFGYAIQSLVCLQDSVLAFHQHGMQGKSLKHNEITQEIYDQTRSFRVIGNDRLVVLQSRPLNQLQLYGALNTIPSDLHILMGHENT
ncbi:unnamed protein product [Rotaria magnacalcarata]|nr:unnamed protein product [Rotaria magnacalcarata]CAF4724028.1 unnamed protein product [Rotaria magnacalcarata]